MLLLGSKELQRRVNGITETQLKSFQTGSSALNSLKCKHYLSWAVDLFPQKPILSLESINIMEIDITHVKSQVITMDTT